MAGFFVQLGGWTSIRAFGGSTSLTVADAQAINVPDQNGRVAGSATHG